MCGGPHGQGGSVAWVVVCGGPHGQGGSVVWVVVWGLGGSVWCVGAPMGSVAFCCSWQYGGWVVYVGWVAPMGRVAVWYGW